MRPSDFDYSLPPTLIAQYPLPQRDESRLLIVNRQSKQCLHRLLPDLLSQISPQDLLIFNDSKVFPARVRGVRSATGGEVEFLLLEETKRNEWWCLARPAKRLKSGGVIEILTRDQSATEWRASFLEKNEEGHCHMAFSHRKEPQRSMLAALEDDCIGEVPLPPYIKRHRPDNNDLHRYQTVFASQPGSVAAPTAGLHFTPLCLTSLAEKGVALRFVTLHVGLGTFAPVKVEEFSDHVMHEERYHLPADTAEAISDAKRRGGRVIAVGTTSLRVIESAALLWGDTPQASSGRTRLFVHPPFHFKVVDALLTNFHLPRSTLLALVSAFANPGATDGRDLVLGAYREAISEGYRFFSYGDAMFIH